MHCAKLKLSQKAFEDTLFPQFLVVFLTRALLQLKEAVEGRNKKKISKNIWCLLHAVFDIRCFTLYFCCQLQYLKKIESSAQNSWCNTFWCQANVASRWRSIASPKIFLGSKKKWRDKEVVSKWMPQTCLRGRISTKPNEKNQNFLFWGSYHGVGHFCNKNGGKKNCKKIYL